MQNIIALPQLQTPRQVQRVLNVTWDELFQMIQSNQLPAYHIHGVFRFRPSDVADFRHIGQGQLSA